jgi:hypothetical protein
VEALAHHLLITIQRLLQQALPEEAVAVVLNTHQAAQVVLQHKLCQRTEQRFMEMPADLRLPSITLPVAVVVVRAQLELPIL